MVRADNYDFLKDSFYYDEPVDPAAVPKKARIDKEIELYEVGKRKICYSDIDYNMHMNNTHYPDMICDFLDEMADTENEWRVKSMSLSYIKESHLGATLTVMRSERQPDGTVYVRTLGESGETCLESVVELEK
jgi:acyl-ACP thioesterase